MVWYLQNNKILAKTTIKIMENLQDKKIMQVLWPSKNVRPLQTDTLGNKGGRVYRMRHTEAA